MNSDAQSMALSPKTRMMLVGIAYGLNSIEIISHALDFTMNIPLIRAKEKRRGDALQGS